MSAGRLNRTLHRWLSVAFTLGFAVNFAAQFLDPYPIWLGLFALLPLLGLLATGIPLFVQPYWRRLRKQTA